MLPIIQDNIILCDNKDRKKLRFNTIVDNDGILDVLKDDNGTQTPIGHICVYEDAEVREMYEEGDDEYNSNDYNYILINHEVVWLNSIKFI